MAAKATANPTRSAKRAPSQKQAVRDLAKRVFENSKAAERWFNQPNFATDNRPPAELLESTEGCAQVKNLLLRIEYGVLA